jgi:hypothetical protein
MQSLMGSTAIAHEVGARIREKAGVVAPWRVIGGSSPATAKKKNYFPTTARPGDVTKAHAVRAAAVVKALALPHPCGHPVRLTPAHDPVPFLPFDDALLAPGGPLAAHLDPTCVLVFAEPVCLPLSLAALRAALCTVAGTGAGLAGPVTPGRILFCLPGSRRFLWGAAQLRDFVEETRDLRVLDGAAPCWGPGYGASEADAVVRLVLADAAVAADWRASAPGSGGPGVDHVVFARAAVADLREAAAAAGVVGAATASPDALLDGMAPVDLDPPPQPPGESKVEVVVRLLLAKIEALLEEDATRESAAASAPGASSPGRGRGPPGQRVRGRGSTARERLTARLIAQARQQAGAGSACVARACHLAGYVDALVSLAELFDNTAIFVAARVARNLQAPVRDPVPDADIATPVERAASHLLPFFANHFGVVDAVVVFPAGCAPPACLADALRTSAAHVLEGGTLTLAPAEAGAEAAGVLGAFDLAVAAVLRFKPAYLEIHPFAALKTAAQADARFEAHPLIVLEKAGLLPAGMSVILHSACAFETHPAVVARVLAHLRDADVCLILAAQPAWSADLYASMLAVEGAVDGAADAVDAPLLDMCEPARHGDWEGTAFPLVTTLSDGTVRLAVRLAGCSYMAEHAAILGVLPFELAAKHYVAAGRRDAAAALEAAARAMERSEAPPTPFVGFKAQVFVLDACEAAFRAAGMKVELDENVDLLLVPEGREDSES